MKNHVTGKTSKKMEEYKPGEEGAKERRKKNLEERGRSDLEVDVGLIADTRELREYFVL